MLWFVEHFFCGSRCCDIKVCGFYGGSTGLQCGILGSRLQCGVGVLGGSLLNILKDLVDRIFEVLQVYWLVLPSTDQDHVVLRFVRELGNFQQRRFYLLSIFP